MAATAIFHDWLKTPGIATRSVKEIQSVPESNRWKYMVVLGFRGSVGEKMKENHDRHMKNLKERYLEMVNGERVEGKSEEGRKEEEKTDVPSFGTQSSFCDKVWKPQEGSALPSPRVPTPTRKQVEQLHFDKSPVPNLSKMNHSRDFNGFDNKPNNQQNLVKPSPPKMDYPRGFKEEFANKKHDQPTFDDLPNPELAAKKESPKIFPGFIQSQQPIESSSISISTLPNYTEKFEGFLNSKELHKQVLNLSIPLYIETDLSKVPKTWNRNPDKFGSFGIYKADQPLATGFSDSGSCSTPNCSTPNEDQLFDEHDRSPDPSPKQNPEDPIPDITPKGISFEIVHDANSKIGSGCVNPLAKEKIRRHDKEPTAAGKRYLKPLDIVNNSESHQLQTLIKFDKHRVRKWVSRFKNFPPSSEPTACRRRRYSNTVDDVNSDLSLIVPEGGEEKSEEEKRAEETFALMRRWIENAEWPLEDAARINFPKKNSTILVRVVYSEGHRATVVPTGEFDRMDELAKTHINLNSPPRLSHDFSKHAFVILEQETDKVGQMEYRRGWIFDGNKKTVKVLLIDERRIVTVPRSQLVFCPETVMMAAPPLCVAATFQRELMDHEKELLLVVGCTAKCRVIEEGGDTLKLHLTRINAEGHSLDVMFCGEECAGACYVHQNE